MRKIIETSDDSPLPIRDISRLTGVNSVTLRAWERRYGLIKPLRTAKGHRLYRREDIELIKKIQTWLARGLAIGKVSELLEAGYASSDVVIENSWQVYCAELLSIMADLNLGKLDAFFNQLFSVYPAAVIADQLITPVLDQLAQDFYGNRVKKIILENRLSEYLLMLTQRQRQQTSGNSVAILQLSTVGNSLLNVLLHYGLTTHQIKSELIGLISSKEIVFAAEQLAIEGFIVYNDSCSSLGEFQRELVQLADLISVPIFVGGKLGKIINMELPNHVHIVGDDGQQAITQMLNSVLLQDSLGGVKELV
ncbi:MAG: MerR family transcriptional regulator [Gammaproteobacteria bacterium]|nr:MAG: MerR family transcriptional regulator [Gammaproteobacteria bacterium]